MTPHTEIFYAPGFKHEITLVVICHSENPEYQFGIGNGYMIIHPDDFSRFMKISLAEDITKIEFAYIHRGITYNNTLSDFMNRFDYKIEYNLSFRKRESEKNNIRVFGFDTAHEGDIRIFNTVESIINEMKTFLTDDSSIEE